MGQARRKAARVKLRVLNLNHASDGAPGRAWRQRNEMSFTPTTAQLELLADLEMARMPVALIADRLGVDHATFKAWSARLAAARNYVEPELSFAEIMRRAAARSSKAREASR